MVDFSYEVISQIKDAVDNNHVKSIVEKSLDTLAARNGIFNSKRKFTMNMVMALRFVREEGLNAKASANISHAIEVFEALRKKDYSNLF